MTKSAIAQSIGDLCAAFKLPTVGAEAVPRFREAGHAEALETLLDVLEMEAAGRSPATGRSAPAGQDRADL